MEKYQQLYSQAKKEIEITHHLLFVTFPLLKETKFLTTISNHIIKASRLALESLLEYKRHYKEIDPFPNNFAVMVNIYQTQLERDLKFDKNYARLLTQLLEVQKFERESKVRFKRKQAYILTREDFSIMTLDREKVTRYARVSKNLIRDIGKVIKNEP
jgi:hypothetical protein